VRKQNYRRMTKLETHTSDVVKINVNLTLDVKSEEEGLHS
jgi:hypothetical protein